MKQHVLEFQYEKMIMRQTLNFKIYLHLFCWVIVAEKEEGRNEIQKLEYLEKKKIVF